LEEEAVENVSFSILNQTMLREELSDVREETLEHWRSVKDDTP
jgi:hypothetical protein